MLPADLALQGDTPLHTAARHGQAEAVKVLLEADRPGVVDTVRAAVCCRRSAFVDIRSEVGALAGALIAYIPAVILDFTRLVCTLR